MPFLPPNHNFVFLPGHDPAPGVSYYELKNHPKVSGEMDCHRLNVFLSQDGNFVTIWFGLLESAFLLPLFEDICFEPSTYDEPLFRGYIENDRDAAVILKALRLKSFQPNQIRKYEKGKIICALLTGP